MTKQEVQRAEPVVLEVKVPRDEPYTPWSAPLWRALAYLLEFIPSYRDSRQGRKNAAQVRVILIVAGLFLMAFGGGEWAGWIVIGAILAFSAFAVPIKELRKRTLRGKLRDRSRQGQREVLKPGSLRLDERQVELWVGDEKLRQVRIDRDRHEVIFTTHKMMMCYGVRPRGGRKQETIWVCTSAIVDPPLPAPQELGVEKPARIGGAQLAKLKEALGVDE